MLGRAGLLTLASGEARFAVEVVETFEFHEFDSSFGDSAQESQDRVVVGRFPGAFGDCESAAVDIDGEGFFESVWPDFHSSVGDHFQDHAVGGQGLEFGGKSVDGVGPGDKDVGTDEFAFFRGPDVGWAGCQGAFGSVAIVDSPKNFRFFAESSDDGFGEFFGPDFFFGDAFFEDIVGVNAIFDGFEPSVVG